MAVAIPSPIKMSSLNIKCPDGSPPKKYLFSRISLKIFLSPTFTRFNFKPNFFKAMSRPWFATSLVTKTEPFFIFFHVNNVWQK